MEKEIGIVGFGNQGEPWGLNLRDSGWRVRTFFRGATPHVDRARSLGFEPEPLDRIGSVPVLALLIPDDAMPSFCSTYLNSFREGQALCFAHGFTLHYRTASWPASADWILVAPQGIGTAVRECFLAGSGVPAVIAIENDFSKHAWEIAQNVAEGLGSAKAGIYEGTVKEEVETDLFSEQALLCGGVPALVAETYDVLVKGGVKPEIAYLECVHELKFIVDLFQRRGIHDTLRAASPTAQFGGFQASRRLISSELRKELETMLAEIRKGTFAQALATEAQGGFPKTNEAFERLRASSIEAVGERVRKRIQGESFK
ncbi:MAG: ketol-acid reductoisomerase [Pseudomonadota bacterium]